MTDAFVKYINETLCEFQIEADKVATSDIEAGIRTIIKDILDAIKETVPTFEMSDVIPTGSFYEGTKIGAPDEFDFMIVLKQLTGPDKLNLHRGCSDWYPQIELKKGVVFSRKYMVNTFINDEHRHKNFLGSSRILALYFWREVRDMLKRKTFSIDTARGTISSDSCKKKKLLFFYRHKVKKSLPKPKNEAEAKLAMVFVESLTIGVDLMLVIEYPCLEFILQLPGFPNSFKKLLFEHKCHIVAKSCHKDHSCFPACWFISFSTMERELMNGMNEHHKKCYRILKSLIASDISISWKCMNLSSYVLKTAFLFHVYGETECLYSRTLSTCIKDVLHYLSTNLFHIRMPCFFARDMNTWGHILETPCYHWGKPNLLHHDEPESLKVSTHHFEPESLKESSHHVEPELLKDSSHHVELESLKDSSHHVKPESLNILPHPVELCWIKLMYKFIQFLIVSFEKATRKTQNEWDDVIFKCSYFRAAVSRLMELYSDRTKYDVFRLEGDLGTLAPCTYELFKDYIKSLDVNFSIKLYFLMP